MKLPGGAVVTLVPLMTLMMLASPAPAHAELARDLGVEAGGSMSGSFWFGIGAAVHAGVTTTASQFIVGASLAADLTRFFDDGGVDDNGAPLDAYHVSARLRGGPDNSPLYVLLGFGATYVTNRLDEGERFEVPSISHWSAALVTGAGMDLGYWGIELNVRQPIDGVLVTNSGFALGIQFDLRVGVRL